MIFISEPAVVAFPVALTCGACGRGFGANTFCLPSALQTVV